jgi:hypothetical protein
MPSRIQTAALFVIAVILLAATLWAGSVGQSRLNPRWSQPVRLEQELLGYVHLRPLELENGFWTLNIYFEPLNHDLRVLREHSLRWWQIADRDNLPGYPRMDLQRGTSLPGSPGDDDDPAYYTRREKLGLGGYFSPEEIFRDNKYWLRDSPAPDEGVRFEAWLVRQGDLEIERLLGFEWGLVASPGYVERVHEPEFISHSRYHFPTVLKTSGFGADWKDITQSADRALINN